MEIRVDIGEIAEAKISELEKKVRTLSKKLDKAMIELKVLKQRERDVKEALDSIKSFASDLPNWDYDD